MRSESLHTDLAALLARIEDAIHTPLLPLTVTAWRTPEPVPFAERTSGQQLDLQPGDPWGGLFDCAWFRFRGSLPPVPDHAELVALLDVNGEMCVVDGNGDPVRGLTNVSSEFDRRYGRPGKRVLPLDQRFILGDGVEIWADAGCNDLFGQVQENAVIRLATLALANPVLRSLYYDLEVLADALQVLPPDSARTSTIHQSLLQSARLLSGGLEEGVVAEARRLLTAELECRNGSTPLLVSAVGHAHMDLAWLWPLRETRRKGARTFATALANMERYPQYVFAASQAQLFEWIEQDHPALFERIRQQVQAGRLEVQGSLWAECDTNLTGGESLVRQVLYGRRFFRQEFGLLPAYEWLPDVFGYSGALPQILRRSGIPCFGMQKMCWNSINRFAYHSFNWQGIDGSSVLVHNFPDETYCSQGLPSTLATIEQNYEQKGLSGHALMVFGIGDGGGGPGEEHLERLQRLEDFAGLPPVRQESARRFFERLSAEAGRLPTWQGEMYLEKHQGTLTTQARSKRFNRRLELALRDAELLGSIAAMTCGTPYPAARLNEVWKEALLYQFHDILPGSSIKQVYDECLPRYEEMLTGVERITSEAQASLAAAINTTSFSKPAVVFNTLPWPRQEWLELAGGWQPVAVPPLGWVVVDGTGAPGQSGLLSASPECLENEHLKACFAADGTLVSLLDKAQGWQVIPSGQPANRYSVYVDNGDAWDFPSAYAATPPRHPELCASRAQVRGPLAVLQQEYRLGDSRLQVEVRLAAGSTRLDFHVLADWHERRAMLRVAFPVDVQVPEAAYEIQFGHLWRPTHENTSWDRARQECAAHRWVDLSHPNRGVALLNDCKYGHRIKGGIIDLNLIRSVPFPGQPQGWEERTPVADLPDRFTDQGDHVFSYALYPHTGGLIEGQVARAGLEFNVPLLVLPASSHPGNLPASGSWLQLEPGGIMLEALKQADDGRGWVARLYEADGCPQRGGLRINLPAGSVEEVNLVEEPLGSLTLRDGTVPLDFGPFEIKTIRFQAG